MLKSAGHAGDFGGAGTHCPGHVAPGGRHLGDLPDDGAGLWQVEAKQGGCGLEQVQRTGAVVEVDAGGQHAGLEIDGERVEVVGGRQNPARLAQPQEAMVAQVIVAVADEHVEHDAPEELLEVCVDVRRDAPQAQANPLQAFGSAPPPTAPQPAQPPVAAKAKAARAARSAIGGAVWGGDDSEE